VYEKEGKQLSPYQLFSFKLGKFGALTSLALSKQKQQQQKTKTSCYVPSSNKAIKEEKTGAHSRRSRIKKDDDSAEEFTSF
jgi:hypothetical protein